MITKEELAKLKAEYEQRTNEDVHHFFNNDEGRPWSITDSEQYVRALETHIEQLETAVVDSFHRGALQGFIVHDRINALLLDRWLNGDKLPLQSE